MPNGHLFIKTEHKIVALRLSRIKSLPHPVLTHFRKVVDTKNMIFVFFLMPLFIKYGEFWPHLPDSAFWHGSLARWI